MAAVTHLLALLSDPCHVPRRVFVISSRLSAPVPRLTKPKRSGANIIVMMKRCVLLTMEPRLSH